MCKVKIIKKVIEACALKPDLEMLPGGDQVKSTFTFFYIFVIYIFGFPRLRSARRASTCPAGRSRGSAWPGEKMPSKMNFPPIFKK